MEYIAEIAQLLAERLVDFQARTPATARSKEINRKTFLVLQTILMVIALSVASILPALFAFSMYKDGYISTFYFDTVAVLIISTLITSLLIIPKILFILRQYSENSIVYQPTNIENDIKYELGLELISFALTFIPFAHLIFCPLTLNRALNILETTNSSKQSFRKTAVNIAGFAIVVFMANSLIVSVAIIILGDTRH